MPTSTVNSKFSCCNLQRATSNQQQTAVTKHEHEHEHEHELTPESGRGLIRHSRCRPSIHSTNHSTTPHYTTPRHITSRHITSHKSRRRKKRGTNNEGRNDEGTKEGTMTDERRRNDEGTNGERRTADGELLRWHFQRLSFDCRLSTADCRLRCAVVLRCCGALRFALNSLVCSRSVCVALRCIALHCVALRVWVWGLGVGDGEAVMTA